MGIKDKMMNSMITETTKQLGKVLESIHGYLEIQTKEMIRMRLEARQTDVTDEQIQTILDEHQSKII